MPKKKIILTALIIASGSILVGCQSYRTYSIENNGVVKEVRIENKRGKKVSVKDGSYGPIEDLEVIIDGFYDNYIFVKGENTVYVKGENDAWNDKDTFWVNCKAFKRIDGQYYDTEIKTISFGDNTWYGIYECSGEYYMEFEVPKTAYTAEYKIEDNRNSEFQVLDTANGSKVYVTYIDCPLEAYEFYVDGEKMDLSLAYE